MIRIKPLLLLDFETSELSGGHRRNYEMVRLGKSAGIEYVLVTTLLSCRNAVKMFPDFKKVISTYRVFEKNFGKKPFAIPGIALILAYVNILRSALYISKVALAEKVDLIVGDERLESIITSYLAGKFSGKPWTAVFQPTTELFQPSLSIGSLNVANILRFVNEKLSEKKEPLFSRIGFAISLLILLKVAEKSLLLSVSKSVIVELRLLNPNLTFYEINPGNGIDIAKFTQGSRMKKCYDALFFGRLLPKKGLFDLPIIWKFVTEKKPEAKLAVAGITEDQSHVKFFFDMVHRNNLDPNVIFLGKLEEGSLINSMRVSKLALNPSTVDSFSLVTLESLACGTPVVAYNIPAILHNFGQCKAVFRCPISEKKCMANSVLHILDMSEEGRNSLSFAAREFAMSYEWDDVVKAQKEAYFKVIEYFGSTQKLIQRLKRAQKI